MSLRQPTRLPNAFKTVKRSSTVPASPGSTKEPLRLPASISSEAKWIALRSKNRTKLKSNYFEQIAAWSAGVAPAGLVGWMEYSFRLSLLVADIREYSTDVRS